MTTDIQEKENEELCKLININEDACEFYESAQEQAENPQIKTVFGNLENLHKNVIISLQQKVRSNGGDPEADETFAGKTAQFFGKIAAKISNDVDETLVKHLEEAEDRCLHSIQDAMKSSDVTPSTRALLQDEYASLRKSHDYMKSLKDQMKAA